MSINQQNSQSSSHKNHVKKILRLPEVKFLTGCSRSAIYQKISKGTFPKPILIGTRAVGWLESEILEWIEHQIKNTRNLTREN